MRRVPPEVIGTALASGQRFRDLAYSLPGPIAGLLTPFIGYRQVFLHNRGLRAAGRGGCVHLLRGNIGC